MFRQPLSPKGFLTLLAIVALLSLPFIIRHEYWIYVLTIGFYYAILASTWNVMAGYLGRVSFAHAAFAAIGAYASALSVLHLKVHPVLGMAIGTVAGAVFSFFIGYLSLRLRGVYFTLSTLAFAEIFRIIVTVEYEYTRGSLGLETEHLIVTMSYIPYYYVALALLLGTVFSTYLILNSAFGLKIMAVGNSEEAAEAIGIDSAKVKVVTFLYVSALTSLAGAFYGHFIGLVSPEVGAFDQLALIIAMTVVGGMGTLPGPVIGALLLEFFSEYLREFGIFRLLIFAGLIIVTVRFFRRGLYGTLKERLISVGGSP
ncbi:MAG: branched-chain amino acid ABC transporter permease [Desulfurococcales archaeon ex4484_204]|nr:MAG: branched-chain amino acid ABC transporter permease [Desulfurococcales archaeon ex4484_204]